MCSLTHWGRVTHIWVSNLTIFGSDNDLSPDRRHAIIWTNAGLLLIGPWGTNFSEIFIEILTSSFKKMHLKVSSAKRRSFCLGLNVLRVITLWHTHVWITSVFYCRHRISYSRTPVSGRIGVDFNGWFLAVFCCLETSVIVETFILN